MAILKPEGGLVAFGVLALVAAFASATQDIVIDAWRIESSDNGEELALLSAGYQLGYRAALLVTDALILILAAYVGWSVSYEMMALAMGVGLVATYLAREPAASLRAADRARLAADAAGPVRRDRRPVHRVLQAARQLGAADAGGDQPVSPAGLRDGADGQSVLRRPGHRQGNRRRGARLVRAGRVGRRHRRRRPVRAALRLHRHAAGGRDPRAGLQPRVRLPGLPRRRHRRVHRGDGDRQLLHRLRRHGAGRPTCPA